MEKRYIGPKELAEYLGVKVDTVYAWCWKGEIPHYRPGPSRSAYANNKGRLIRFDLREIDKWMERRRVKELH